MRVIHQLALCPTAAEVPSHIVAETDLQWSRQAAKAALGGRLGRGIAISSTY